MGNTFFSNDIFENLTVSDYITAFENGEAKSALKYLNTSLITFISYPTTPIFSSYEMLEYVNLPNCTYVGNSAFENCIKLKEAQFLNTSYIGYYAFDNCYNLEYVNFSKVSYIDTGAFKDCSKLNNVFISNNIYIGDYVFSGCISLKNINMPNCYGIGAGAFYGCEELEEAIFPNINTFGYGAFENCYKLSNVIFNDLSYLSLSNKYVYVIGYFKNCSELRNVSFPNLISINNFFKLSSLSQSIRNSSFYLYCDRDIFEGCSNLSIIEFPESMETFIYCTSLSYDIYLNISENIPNLSICAQKVHLPNLKSLNSQTFKTDSSFWSNSYFITFLSSFSYHISECFINELYLDKCSIIDTSGFCYDRGILRYQDIRSWYYFSFLKILSIPNVKYISSSVVYSMGAFNLRYLYAPECSYIDKNAFSSSFGLHLGRACYSWTLYKSLPYSWHDFEYVDCPKLLSIYKDTFKITSISRNVNVYSYIEDLAYSVQHIQYRMSYMSFHDCQNFNFYQQALNMDSLYLDTLENIIMDNVADADSFYYASTSTSSYLFSLGCNEKLLHGKTLYLSNVQNIIFNIFHGSYSGIFYSAIVSSRYIFDYLFYAVYYPLMGFNYISAPRCSNFTINFKYSNYTSEFTHVGCVDVCNSRYKTIYSMDSIGNGQGTSESYYNISNGLYLPECKNFQAGLYTSHSSSTSSYWNSLYNSYYYSLVLPNVETGIIYLWNIKISELYVPKFSGSIVINHCYLLESITAGSTLDITGGSNTAARNLFNLSYLNIENTIYWNELAINTVGSNSTTVKEYDFELQKCITINQSRPIGGIILSSYKSEISYVSPFSNGYALKRFNCKNLETIYTSGIYTDTEILLPKLNSINHSSTIFVSPHVQLGVSTLDNIYLIDTNYLDLPNVKILDSPIFKPKWRITGSNETVYINSGTGNPLNLSLPNVEYIGASIFDGHNGIGFNISSVLNLPKCSYIGNNAFRYTASCLKFLNLPNVEYIGNYAFYQSIIIGSEYECALSAVTLPKCSYIGLWAFRIKEYRSDVIYQDGLDLLELGYNGVVKPTFMPSSKPYGTQYFELIIKVPESLKDSYLNDSDWATLLSKSYYSRVFIISD